MSRFNLRSGAPRRMRGVAAITVLAVLAIAAAIWTGGLVPTPRESIEAVMDKADPSHRGVRLKLANPVLRIGHDALAFSVEVGRPGHLVIIQAGTDGKTLDLLLPNQLDGDTRIGAGKTLLPRKGWQLKAGGPAGEGVLLAVVTDEAPDVAAIQAALAHGRLPDFGRYGAALLTWHEVADEEKAR